MMFFSKRVVTSDLLGSLCSAGGSLNIWRRTRGWFCPGFSTTMNMWGMRFSPSQYRLLRDEPSNSATKSAVCPVRDATGSLPDYWRGRCLTGDIPE